MTDMRLVVVGAGGRMGSTLIRAIRETKGCVLAGAIERENHPHLGKDAGLLAGAEALNVPLASDALAAFAKADGVLDFTTPAASAAFAALAAQARLVHVIGTTGLGAAELEKLRAAARHAVIIQSGNMSLGVNLLAGLVKQAAAALGPEFDIEIVEMHHRHKVDAPSGTAYLLGEAAARGRGIELGAHSASGRHGQTGARREGDIGFAAMRGGSVTGDHSVVFAGPRERLTLSHHAEDRGLFASGAVRAALWGRGRKPGLYSMTDVLGLPG
ncbi:MAG: 4-hydroxy-tetrahydrodipicolinate reductase [Hyphomicrobiales bacterium]|nr:4-hydroxy-tetrahydrodipicolinate reductase [Hyphomicrobiales bacterium]MBV9591941.1 4-hydroxy-tetrahydrodipicolinate reductase [Hyphomicrobiales bacterium]